MSENIEFTEDQADEILNDIEKPTDQETQQVTPVEEFSFTYEGKEVKGNRDQMLKWASQGYNAPNKIGELNSKLKGYSDRESKIAQYEQKYGPVDKFMQDNPGFWDEVYNAYQSKLQNNQMQTQQNTQVDLFKKELDDLKNFKLELQQERENERIKKEDANYSQELQELSKAYPSIDFQTLGQDGKSLEYKVLEHARENGIRKFTTAFRDFYHDELMKMNSEKTKTDFIKDKQWKKANGILGETTSPTKQISGDVRGKSYGDLEREALAELGILN
jgi:hypothetical protein